MPRRSTSRIRLSSIHLLLEEPLSKHQRTDFDHARDELMSHIHRCGVLKASTEQQDQWLDDTMQFMAERYADLGEEQLGELAAIGRRFCQPVIPHGRGNTAISTAEPSVDEADANAESEVEVDADADQEEPVGVA